MTNKKISIVVPACNEQDNVAELHRRVAAALASEPCAFELLFVDDGSTDATLDRIRELHRADPRVKALSLSRNFGHQAALTAGLDAVSGDAVVMMDADLQHPPECIPEMLRRWEQGFEIVSMVRGKTSGAGPLKNLSSSLFYLIINRIGNVGVERNASDFRLLDRSVVTALRGVRERARFLRGIIGWVGFRKTSILFTAPPRAAGETKYGFRKMLGFAVDAVVSFSTFPLRISTYIGLLSILLGLAYFVYTICIKLSGRAVQGWSSLVAVVVFFGGVQLLMLGVIGEYIARIVDETKHRPVYIVRAAVGDVAQPPER